MAFGAILLAGFARLTAILCPAFVPSQQQYNYAPCFVQVQDQLHVWYCANEHPGEVRDAIFHRQATRTKEGWAWGAETVALRPAERGSAWDSRHVCDPEVLAGRFLYLGRRWQYVLLYLGTDAEGSTHNQVGAAFSNSLDGPWHRYPRPLVTYTKEPDGGVIGTSVGWPIYRFWGVGQPTAIPVGNAGRLLILYSRGEEIAGEEMVWADLSNMDRGPVLGKRMRVPTGGVCRTKAQGRSLLNNLGIAFGPPNYVYMVCDGPPPTDGLLPDFIAASVEVYRIPWKDLKQGAGRWTRIATLDAGKTGWPRNHNACILKDLQGRVPSERVLTVGLSVAEAYSVMPPDFAWLWTYRVALMQVPLPK